MGFTFTVVFHIGVNENRIKNSKESTRSTKGKQRIILYSSVLILKILEGRSVRKLISWINVLSHLLRGSWRGEGVGSLSLYQSQCMLNVFSPLQIDDQYCLSAWCHSRTFAWAFFAYVLLCHRDYPGLARANLRRVCKMDSTLYIIVLADTAKSLV